MGTTSAGLSGTRSLAVGAAPSVGAALNGLTPADFNGTDQFFSGAVVWSNLFATTGYSVVVLFNADTAGASDTNAHSEPGLVSGDTNTYSSVNYSAMGCRAGIFDANGWQNVNAAAPTGGYHLCEVRFTGTALQARVDSGAFQSVSVTNFTAGGAAGLGAGVRVGRGTGSRYFDGRIAEIMTANAALTDGQFNQIKTYVNSRYALAL